MDSTDFDSLTGRVEELHYNDSRLRGDLHDLMVRLDAAERQLGDAAANAARLEARIDNIEYNARHLASENDRLRREILSGRVSGL